MFTYSINDRSTTTRTPKYNVIHLACQAIQRAQNCLQNLLDILNHFFLLWPQWPHWIHRYTHMHACREKYALNRTVQARVVQRINLSIKAIFPSRNAFFHFLFLDVFRTTDYKLLTDKNIVNKLKCSPLKPPIEQIKRQNVLADKPHPVQ